MIITVFTGSLLCVVTSLFLSREYWWNYPLCTLLKISSFDHINLISDLLLEGLRKKFYILQLQCVTRLICPEHSHCKFQSTVGVYEQTHISYLYHELCCRIQRPFLEFCASSISFTSRFYLKIPFAVTVSAPCHWCVISFFSSVLCSPNTSIFKSPDIFNGATLHMQPARWSYCCLLVVLVGVDEVAVLKVTTFSITGVYLVYIAFSWRRLFDGLWEVLVWEVGILGPPRLRVFKVKTNFSSWSDKIDALATISMLFELYSIKLVWLGQLIFVLVPVLVVL